MAYVKIPSPHVPAVGTLLYPELEPCFMLCGAGDVLYLVVLSALVVNLFLFGIWGYLYVGSGFASNNATVEVF